MSHLQSDQEEADTKMLLHALDATTSGATTIRIHSPDTDVLVLVLRRYPDLCDDTSFVTGIGQKHRIIPLKPIYEELGQHRAAALPGFHSITGADNTGSFVGKGKLSCWKVFEESSQDIITALRDLGTTANPTETTFNAIEKLICKLYDANTQYTKVKDLRWWLFKKKQAQSERLPPTQSALREAIKRARYQAMVWGSDTVVACFQHKIPREYTCSLTSMTAHLFGGVWSPSCANFAIKRCAKDNAENFDPNTISTVISNFYVDDCLKSVASPEETVRLVKELRQLLSNGGFHLTKWVSNSREVPYQNVSGPKESRHLTLIENYCLLKGPLASYGE
ncbi:hypothetical protein QZH41_013693 [Actinostola sp. cb2023]|nr:hypothetical protein QZH41_013693 [Actinostola sp. cb2023]